MMAASTRQHLNFETCLIQILIELKFHWHLLKLFFKKSIDTWKLQKCLRMSVWGWLARPAWIQCLLWYMCMYLYTLYTTHFRCTLWWLDTGQLGCGSNLSFYWLAHTTTTHWELYIALYTAGYIQHVLSYIAYIPILYKYTPYTNTHLSLQYIVCNYIYVLHISKQDGDSMKNLTNDGRSLRSAWDLFGPGGGTGVL